MTPSGLGAPIHTTTEATLDKLAPKLNNTTLPVITDDTIVTAGPTNRSQGLIRKPRCRGLPWNGISGRLLIPLVFNPPPRPPRAFPTEGGPVRWRGAV